MIEPTPSTGLCPRCESVGRVGEPCEDHVCQRRRYHFVPASLVLGRTEQDPRVGKRVDKYLLLEPLGVGGFGTVYRAMNTALGRIVALKVLTAAPDDPSREMHLRMFANEATALAQLSHPNIVHLIDAGVDEGLPYIVMEHIDNAETLRDDIEARALARRRMPATEAKAILLSVISALEAAHARKIIHRDIKPENVMLQAVPGHGNFVRVLDFGLAKFVSDSTRTARAMGTPRYMAPEQLWARGLGPWTDLYAAGVLAFELMTGRTPYGHSPSGIVAHKRDSAYDPLSVVADVPLPEPARVFLKKALAYQPAHRYRAADDMRVDFKSAYEAIIAGGREELLHVDLAGVVVQDEEEQATNALAFTPPSEDPKVEMLPEVSGVIPVQTTPPAPIILSAPRRRVWPYAIPLLAAAALLAVLGVELLTQDDGPIGDGVEAVRPSPALAAAVTEPPAPTPEPAPAVIAPDVIEAAPDVVEVHETVPSFPDIPSETFMPQSDVAAEAPDVEAPVEVIAAEAPATDPADEARRRRVSAARRLTRAQEQMKLEDLDGAAALVREGLSFDAKNAELRALNDRIAVERTLIAKLAVIASLSDPRAQADALNELAAPDGSISARRVSEMKARLAPTLAALDQAERDKAAEVERERCKSGCEQANEGCEERTSNVAQCIALQPQRCASRCAEQHPDDAANCEAERCQPNAANIDAWERLCQDALNSERAPCRTAFASCVASCGR